MSQLPPDSPYPNGLVPDPMQPHDAPAAYQPKRWSVPAVSGFVLSLIGCMGVPAVLGFILGIWGLVATRDDRRRGRGFAIAALPISVVTGAISVLLLFTVVYAQNVGVVHRQLPLLLGSDPAAVGEATMKLRSVCTDDFNEVVTDERLRDWLGEIRETHGTLAEIQPDFSRIADGGITGKFVNGSAPIQLRFITGRRWASRLDDIAIDGSSPRELE